MSTQTAMLHVRVDEKTKQDAQQALKAMGMSVSDAVRLFLNRVVADQAFPLELKVPNAKTQTAMAEAEQLIQAKQARFDQLEDLFNDLEKNSQ
jgi:DNA-damage-inducible protein J